MDKIMHYIGYIYTQFTAEVEKMPYNSLFPQIGYFNFRKGDEDWKFDPMVIDFHDLSYVIGGGTILNSPGGELPVGPGDLIYMPPGTFRSSQPSGQGIEIFAMNFLLDDRGYPPPEKLPFDTVTHIGVRPDLIKLYQELYHVWMQRPQGYQLTVRAYCELIIAKLMEIAFYKNPLQSADLRIQRLIQYITEHYAEPLLLSDLADMLHLSPVYLSTLFHRDMGVPLKKYINQIRINNAENLLINKICNVSEAAEASGFTDVAYFSRTFTKLKGYTPREIVSRKKMT